MNAQLRKAAIVVSSLDKSAAQALLAQMPPSFAKRVLAAAKSLGKLDPDEQREVMRDFMKSQSPKSIDKAQPASDDDVELALSEISASFPEGALPLSTSPRSVEPVSEQATSRPTEAPAERVRFDFVTRDAAASLAKILGQEQPQLAALIMANLPPERSAEVLTHLRSEVRIPILQRIADIEDASPLVLDEVEAELKSRLSQIHLRTDGSSQGRAALSRILQASNPELRGQISSAMDVSHTAKGDPLAVAAYSDQTLIAADRQSDQPSENIENAAASNLSPKEAEDAGAPRLAFTGLAGLDDISLAAVFGAVTPQIAILALVGADETLVRRILRILPRREAAMFKSKLDEVGPLRLREVELAQTKLSDAATDLLKQRRIVLRSSQRAKLAV